ncbi:hypothetical protein F441_10953 [Phytophthora nicotianae CJ01A1]|uniref:DUF6818 domain-containing protein n=1 Tax=Phytophthora nicotianae CJ01A1 TaxID=1317063 RepID=W2VRI0_PHYNI|nr:hypothetical protein F441_22331 [Phytophthora nicotianae CJ01A1]ETP14076.1 hypothetical protein F441_10953 [Phytophthora nicotianae CJ01A1]
MAPSKSKSGRGKSWTGPELNRMLTAVEDILPLGGNEWDVVAGRYGKELPREFSERDVDAIKRKFLALKNALKPTGDPSCPEEVVRAKRAYYRMESRSGVEAFEDTAPVNTTSTPAPGSPSAEATAPAASSPSGTASTATSVAAEAAIPVAAPPTPSSVKDNANAGARSASQRCGKTPNELANLSEMLKRARKNAEDAAISHTVKRRRTIDNLLDKLEKESGGGTDMVQGVIAMEERAAVRELEYRREREEREAKREERENRRDELFFVLMTKLLGDKPNPTST